MKWIILYVIATYVVQVLIFPYLKHIAAKNRKEEKYSIYNISLAFLFPFAFLNNDNLKICIGLVDKSNPASLHLVHADREWEEINKQTGIIILLKVLFGNILIIEGIIGVILFILMYCHHFVLSIPNKLKSFKKCVDKFPSHTGDIYTNDIPLFTDFPISCEDYINDKSRVDRILEEI